jgi:hypothetical protein
MASRRLSTNQVALLVEGAEMVAQATGLSVAEIVSLVLSEPSPAAEDEESHAGAPARGTIATGA